MEYSDLMIFIMEMLGTVAFASSGAMLGIERKMDIFGVNVLGVTTAVGGGIIRDLILGINPPVTFLHAVYAFAAVITSTLLFLAVYIRNQVFSGNIARWYDRIMLLCDTIGLGIFTVVGSLCGSCGRISGQPFSGGFCRGDHRSRRRRYPRYDGRNNAVYFCEARLCSGIDRRRYCVYCAVSVYRADCWNDDRSRSCVFDSVSGCLLPLEPAAYSLTVLTAPSVAP